MPKINVYLPDDLAADVRDTGVPVSAICQRALEQSVRRMRTIRQAVLGDLDVDKLLPHVTERTVTAIKLGVQHAQESGSASVGTGDLLRGIIGEGANLALQVLRAIDVDPAALPIESTPEPGGDLRFSMSAGNALELGVNEAIAFGHNYVGTEHLLIGLAAEMDGAAGRALRTAGAEPKVVRRAVATALAGYAHLRAAKQDPAPILAAVRAELQPLVRRIEALEQRIS